MLFYRKSSVSFLWHRVRPDQPARWTEDDHQSYIVLKLRDWLQDEPKAFLFHGDQGGIRVKPRTAAKAKALGLERGVPDIHIMLSGGRLICIELKKWGGTVSPQQKERHRAMKVLGFPVHVVKEKTPAEAWQSVLTILHGYGV